MNQDWVIKLAEPIRVVVNSGPGTPWYKNPGFWAVFVPLIVAAATLWHTQRVSLASRRAERRDRLAAEYGRALADAISWTEMPYRIARRTSDNPDVLSALVQQFHGLQERIEHNLRWLQLDSKAVGDAYEKLVVALKRNTEDDIDAAWEREPITTAAGMNIGPISKIDVSAERDVYLAAVQAHLDSLDRSTFRRRSQ